MPLRIWGTSMVIAVCAFASAATADDAVLLKYKFAKGETQYYRVGAEMKQSQTLMGMKLENTFDQESVMSRVVDGIDDAGNVTFKLKAERKKVKASFGPAGKFAFDSKSTERDTGSVIGGELTPILERQTGSEYQIVVSPLGQVTQVKGFAELIADLIKDKPFAAQFGGGSNESSIPTEQDSFVVLRDKPVKPGEKWEVVVEADLPKLGKMKSRNVYTYEGPDMVGNLRTARIGLTSDVTFDLNLDVAGTKATGTLTTSGSSGTAQFDPASGRLVSAKRTLSLTGQFSVDAGGMTITVDNQQEQVSTVALLEKLPQ